MTGWLLALQGYRTEATLVKIYEPYWQDQSILQHIAAVPNNNNPCFITDEGRFNLTMFLKVTAV